MNHLKEQGFVSWLSELLKVNNPEQLDVEIKRLGEDKIKELANKFNNEIWPVMEKEFNNTEVTYAKAGTKLDYIVRLNGKCPEGYEVEKFMAGGKPCSRCKKKMEAKAKGGSTTMGSIKDEIESKKCGGKAKKKMQDGGKAYDENEHSKLQTKYKSGKVKQGSDEHKRLQELNRKSGHHEDGWNPGDKPGTPSKEDAKKATAAIKKHLEGGKLKFNF